MGTTEDELAKKEVQEAVWAWGGRAAVVGAVFVLGLFAGYWTWGYGEQGAPHLRTAIVALRSKYDELDKKRVDIEGKLTVTDTRLGQCQNDLQKTRAALSAAQAGTPPS